MSIEVPYVGPRPFMSGEASLFYGREREVNLLASLTIIHPLILLYGPSGSGKTSLLNAALIPRLSEASFEVLPPAPILGTRHPAIESMPVRNLFIFNALMHWNNGRMEPRALAQISFADYLEGRRNKQQGSDANRAVSRVVIFDQFEELFVNPELWHEREPFFIQIQEAMNIDRDLHIIFVMREDYVGELDSYEPILPDRMRRFRLEPFRRSEALEAILNPLLNTNYRFAPGVAEKVIDDLLQIHINSGGETCTIEGEFVEPVQLQIVALNILRSLRPDETLITEEDVSRIGNVQNVLRVLYERAVEQVSHALHLEEGAFRRQFQDLLITPAGTRAQILRGSKSAASLPNGVVDILEREYILRGQYQRGAVWYELTNDRLIEPILQSNQNWFAVHGWDIQRHLESRAMRWIDLGKSSALLLNSQELLEAENWLQRFKSSKVAGDAKLLSFIEASRSGIGDEAQRSYSVSGLQRRIDKQALIIRRLLIIIVVLIILLISTTGYMISTRIR